MKPRTGAVVSFAFVELSAECGDIIAALIVGPAVYRCRRLPGGVDAHQAVPEGTGCNVSDVAFRGFCQSFIGRRDGLSKRSVGADLRSTRGGRFQLSIDLDERFRKQIPGVIEESGTNAR